MTSLSSASLRNDNRASVTTLGLNFTFFNGPFCGRFLATSLTIRSNAFWIVMPADKPAGIDCVKAKLGLLRRELLGVFHLSFKILLLQLFSGFCAFYFPW